MAIEFRCNQCGRLLRTGEETAGRMAQCPECGSQTPIPFSTEAEPVQPIDIEPPAAEVAGSPFSGSFGSSPFGSRSERSQADENPYQSPQEAWPAGTGYPPSPGYAVNRVSVPAVGLIVTGAIGLLLHALVLAFSMFVPFVPAPNNPNAPQMPNIFQPALGVGFAVAQHGLAIGLSILLLVGGMKMKKLENYSLCIAASIIALIPCFSPCCLSGLPFGIWALVVLSDPHVKSSFR
jgi:hypothetical protein